MGFHLSARSETNVHAHKWGPFALEHTRCFSRTLLQSIFKQNEKVQKKKKNSYLQNLTDIKLCIY